jgi:hypothetical protein
MQNNKFKSIKVQMTGKLYSPPIKPVGKIDENG